MEFGGIYKKYVPINKVAKWPMPMEQSEIPAFSRISHENQYIMQNLACTDFHKLFNTVYLIATKGKSCSKIGALFRFLGILDERITDVTHTIMILQRNQPPTVVMRPRQQQRRSE